MLIRRQDAVEERILERATQKLKLDQLVIQEGRAQQAAKGKPFLLSLKCPAYFLLSCTKQG